MASLGFDTGHTQTPITPVILGDEGLAQEFSRRLFEDEAVFAQAIAYPTVPRGTARIRAMVSAAHSDNDLDRCAEAFATVGRALGVVT
jgi:glycine C-acetyltransferase